MGRNREPVESLILYSALKWSVVSPMFHVYFQGRLYGAEMVPAEGPVVVVSNHASHFDGPLIASCIRRPVAFMAKEELFRVPILKQAIILYGGYPVSRGSADRSAIRAALNCLENGWATGIFLQGTRTPDGGITEPKLGAALIAAKAQAPLLPISLWGTEKILQKGSAIPRPVPVTLRIGQLIDPPSSTVREELQAVTQKCAATINAMHDMGR